MEKQQQQIDEQQSHTKKSNINHKKRNRIIFLLIVVDVLSIFFALILAVFIRFEAINMAAILIPWAMLSCLFCALFYFFRLYHSLWKYSGISEALRIIASISIGTLICFVLNELLVWSISRAVLTIFPFLLGVFLIISRFGYRVLRHVSFNGRGKVKAKERASLLIVGAGSGAMIAISHIRNSYANKYRDIVAVDNNPNKQKMRIQGVEVVGYIEDIPAIVRQRGISDIIVAIPSLKNNKLADILDICKETGCRVRMLPLVSETNSEKSADVPVVREIQVNDILFRNEVQLDTNSIGEYLNDKKILVTGGGGSIGSEICRQIAQFNIKSLTIFDIYENTAYELLCELKRKYINLNIEVLIGSVRDIGRLEHVFSQLKPNIVFHAAAHKHVPLMEDSPLEAIKNNIKGTLNTLETAEKHSVERFVNLSTDKAVNPTNIMGATKRMTELVIQHRAKNFNMKCMSVRFGNVLGSHGSVIPLMENQIKNGGPVTVTHPDIVRYFMTIPEASQLVLQAGALANSGSIYVLDMGEPVKIMDLAKKLIKFHGYEPDVDIAIEIIGLRPGEKLYEELAMDEEKDRLSLTAHKRIFKLAPGDLKLDSELLEKMLDMAAANDEGAVELLRLNVPSYAFWEDEAKDFCEVV